MARSGRGREDEKGTQTAAMRDRVFEFIVFIYQRVSVGIHYQNRLQNAVLFEGNCLSSEHWG